MQLSPSKPFKEYPDLINILNTRGMIFQDENKAIRKISQIGYYRLSGFWYVCRKIERDANGSPKRLDDFCQNTNFDEILKLYLFDKKLRFLLLDAIERIETNLKTILAHELGRYNPLAYQDQTFINPKYLKNYYKNKQVKNSWSEWSMRQSNELSRSQEDCIVWHKTQNKNMPIWVVVEAWSFGTLSKYFQMLNGTYQNIIAQRLGVSNPSILVSWLRDLNVLRNRCAHHTRVWNQTQNNPIKIPSNTTNDDSIYFSEFNLSIDSRKKLYGLLTVLWYLVHKIGPNSNWIIDVYAEIENFPDLPINLSVSMGLPNTVINIVHPIDPFLAKLPTT